MDFPSQSNNALRMSAAALAVLALGGCSSSSKELRTPGQSSAFVAEVASGESSSGWSLAKGASKQAVQAWQARASIGGLGQMLRSGARISPPGGLEVSWTCEMADQLIRLGAVRAITSFDSNDVGIVTREAQKYAVKPNAIAAMIHDASTIPFRDLAVATVAVCGPVVS